MASKTLVLYPSPGMGHLVSMVELGKFIIKHHPSFSITILIAVPPYNTGSTAQYIARVTKTTPSITFHYLPVIPLSAIPNHNSANKETVAFGLLLLSNPDVQKALVSISATSIIPAFILDTFCSSSRELAEQLNIPTYYFFTSGVSVLSLFLHIPTIHEKTTESFKDMNSLLVFPGLPPIPSSDMIKPMLDRTDKAYELFIYCCCQLIKSQGIIVNSFDSLEPRALKAVRDGLSVPDAPTPPVYCIGPLIATPVYCIGPLIATDDRSGTEAGSGQASCLEWLDTQPSKSVVFLCFGSLGLFSEAQLKEIAIGLEKSGQRFLWVVRSPPSHEETKQLLAPPEPDLDALLPQGFLERTKDRGFVVKSWAPQVEVLSNESLGGFVTHCGWNSTLEALLAGIPMVAWPLYAEQRINRVLLVEEIKVALSMEEGVDGFVTAQEVEKKVRGLMESEEGSVIRDRVVKLSREAKAAISDGGSSVRAMADLEELWER